MKTILTFDNGIVKIILFKDYFCYYVSFFKNEVNIDQSLKGLSLISAMKRFNKLVLFSKQVKFKCDD